MKRIKNIFLVVTLLLMSGLVFSQTTKTIKGGGFNTTFTLVPSQPQCTKINKNVSLQFSFDMGDKYLKGSTDGSLLNATVKLTVQFNAINGAIIPSPTFTNIYSINDLKPKHLTLGDITPYYDKIASITVTLSQFSISDNKYLPNAEFSATILENFGYDVTQTNVTLGTVSSTNNPVTFNWSSDCAEVPNYQVQILRLYNNSSSYINDETKLSAKVDWSQALTIETQSPENALTLTLAEGRGYYIWRIRPIGTYFDGGIADSRNYGQWTSNETAITINGGSSSNVFFYNGVDDNFNWIYSRIFTEQNNLAENIIFADGLQHVKQNQAHITSQNKLLVNQTIYDYCGRQALKTMAAPIPFQGFAYQNKLVTDSSGNTYTAKNFDLQKNYKTPDQIQGPINDYYSSTNADVTIPDAEGYPFSRTLFKTDGTNQVSEQGSVGKTLQVGSKKTNRKLYGSATEQELIDLFGDEAPKDTTVTKVISIDPNGTISVNFISKEGNTIATSLTGTDDSSIKDNLVSVNSDPANSTKTITDVISGSSSFGNGGIETIKNYAFASSTSFSYDYTINPKTIQCDCDPNATGKCDYLVKIMIVQTDDPTKPNPLHINTLLITPTSTTTSLSGAINLGVGSYSLVKQVIALNSQNISVDSNAVVNQTYLDGFKSIIENDIISNTESKLGSIKTALSNKTTQLSDIYYSLNGLYYPSLDQLTLKNVYQINTNCCSINIPIVTCDEASYGSGSFESYLPQKASSIDDIFLKYNPSTNSFSKIYTTGTSTFPKPTHPFDNMINNMVAEGIYTRKDLFICWRTLIDNYQELAFDEKGNRRTSFNLLESFLNCAASKTGITSTGDKFKYIDYTGFSNHAYGNNGYLEYAYKLFQYSPQPTSNCENSIDVNGSKPTYTFISDDSYSLIGSAELRYKFVTCVKNTSTLSYVVSNLSNSSGQNVFKCNPDPSHPINSQAYWNDLIACAQSFKNSVEDSCKQVCSNRRTGFEDYLKNDYVTGVYEGRNNVITNDILNTYSNGILNISNIDQVTDQNNNLHILDDIHCISQQLVEECSNGCSLSIQYSQSEINTDGILENIFTGVGTDAEILQIKKIMTYDFSITVPNWFGVSCPSASTSYPQKANVKIDNSPYCDEDAGGVKWITTGTATHTSQCNNYQLTDNLSWQKGAIWNPVPVDFSNNLDYTFDLNFGTYQLASDGTDMGADGITFVLQQQSSGTYPFNIIGGVGGFMGFGGNPAANLIYQPMPGKSFGIEFDTYNNEIYNHAPYNFLPYTYDIPQDHVAIVLNGNNTHASGYPQPIPLNYDLEDGKDHKVHFKYNISSKLLEIYIDENIHPSPIINITYDIIGNVFLNNLSQPVIMGFTAATGGAFNKQSVTSHINNGVSLSCCDDQTPDNTWVSNNPATNPYITGSCNCYQITADASNQTNAVWRKQPVDFSKPIDYSFDVYLGNHSNYNPALPYLVNHDDGGDGIAFVIQNTSSPLTSIGQDGGNLGYGQGAPFAYSIYNSGVNSLAVEIDTYDDKQQWTTSNDIPQDHMTMFKNGNMNTPIGTSAPIPVNIKGNIEDGQWHKLRIKWDPVTRYFEAWLGEGNYANLPHISYKMEDGLFGTANNLYYIGFTGASEGAINLQKFCHHVPHAVPCPITTVPTCKPFCFNWVEPAMLPVNKATSYDYVSCNDDQKNYLLNLINNQISQCVKSQQATFEANYLSKCGNAKNISDNLTVHFTNSAYQYTLYYYDRAGNLIKTVPPQGVVAGGITRNDHPANSKVSEYQYNSLKQLVKQHTPDGDEVNFIYNDKGQLRFSQNKKQYLEDSYSYTLYDGLGRITQVGKAFLPQPTSPPIYQVKGKFEDLSSSYIVNDNTQYEATMYCIHPFDITYTYYSAPTNIDYKGLSQQFLQNRVSFCVKDDDGISSTGDEIYTYYSYDPHGNVEWMAEKTPVLGTNFIKYTYDLVSGKVTKVAYNEGREDQFYHRYKYDADNRITSVETSRDSVIWENDANYSYNAHGPLKRAEIGNDQLQGLDYIYTLQGWLKSVNHPSLNPVNDIRQDGLANNFANDVFASTLGYFDGDFKHTRSNFNSASTDLLNPISGYQQLYNGNISTWTHNTKGLSLLGEKFQYDQLNRLAVSNTLSQSAGSWLDFGYATSYSYDKDGNILNLTRNREISTPVLDNMAYTYNDINRNNKLTSISDNASDANGQADDFKGTSAYDYDDIGNLKNETSNNSNYLITKDITWNNYGKMSRILISSKAQSTGIITNTKIDFSYNANGNRIMKKVTNLANSTFTSSYYMHDATGNIMGVYSYDGTTLKLTEQPIYGSSRIGENTKSVTISSLNRTNLPVNRAYSPVTTTIKNYDNNWSIQGVNQNHQIINFGSTPPSLTIDNDNIIDNFIIYNVNNYNYFANNCNALAEDVNGNIMFRVSSYVTCLNCSEFGDQTTFKFVTLGAITDKNTTLMKGSSNLNMYLQSKAVTVQVPGNKDAYYLIYFDQSGKMYYAVIDMSRPGWGSVNNPMGEVVKKNILISSGPYNNTDLALIENQNDGAKNRLFAKKIANGKAYLCSFDINQSGIIPLITTEIGATLDNIFSKSFIRISQANDNLFVSNNNTWVFNDPEPPYIPFVQIESEAHKLWVGMKKYYNSIKALGIPNRFVLQKYPLTNFDLPFNPNTIVVLEFLNILSNAPTGAEISGSSSYFYISSPTYILSYVPGKTTCDKNLNYPLTFPTGDLRRGKDNNIYMISSDLSNLSTSIYRIDNSETINPSISLVTPNIPLPTKFIAHLPAEAHRTILTGNSAPSAYCNILTNQRELGNKTYELTDHLGNVRATISDKKVKDGTATSGFNGFIAHFDGNTDENSYFRSPITIVPNKGLNNSGAVSTDASTNDKMFGPTAIYTLHKNDVINASIWAKCNLLPSTNYREEPLFVVNLQDQLGNNLYDPNTGKQTYLTSILSAQGTYTQLQISYTIPANIQDKNGNPYTGDINAVIYPWSPAGNATNITYYDDMQVAITLNSNFTALTADVLSQKDYYPFGMLMPERALPIQTAADNTSLGTKPYRFGFNGKESDFEVNNTGGTSLDYGMRQYDPRVGRFFKVDPITKKYPELTPYQFASNSPIDGVDLDGLEHYYASDGTLIAKWGDDTQVKLLNDKFLKDNKGVTKYAVKDLDANSTDVGMKSEELNMRAMLTVMQKYEAGSGSDRYYKWNGGKTFTDTDDHPGVSSGSTKAAGAYQIMTNSWTDSYTGVKLRNKYDITDFSPTSQDIFTVATIKDKATVKAYNNIISGDFKGAAKKMAGEWRFLPGPKQQGNLKIQGMLGDIKTAISSELKGVTQIETPKGQLLAPFSNK